MIGIKTKWLFSLLAWVHVIYVIIAAYVTTWPAGE